VEGAERVPESAELTTMPLPSPASPPASRPRPSRARSGFWRELSGALTVGMAVLAAVVLVFQLLAWLRGMPGPGLLMVLGHVLAAVLVVLAQQFADRRTGWVSALAVTGTALVAGATLWLFWWA
jgi:hypothetical protein